jgi:hypothetical protein
LYSGIREIRIAKVVIDPVPVNDQVVVGRFARDNVENLYLLHQPIAGGRYSTSVLAAAKLADASMTKASPPVVLATFEWSPRRFLGIDRPPAPIVGSRLICSVPPQPGGKLARWNARRGMASAPTPLAWTRTGRDHSRWLRYMDGESEPVSASTLRPTLTQSKLDFGAPWLCSSTFADPRTPVHVHRRLAVIATRYASGGGRPVELYSGAALLDGQTATFAQLKDSAADLCRLVEFETPAMVLTNKSSTAVPATYRSAYFDFRSSLVDDIEPTSRTIEFYFRFVGRSAHLMGLTKLTIFLTPPGSAVIETGPAFDLAGGNPYPVGLRLRFVSEGVYSALFLMSDGSSTQPQKAPDIAAPKITSDGLILKVQAQMAKEGGEFWTDVSLLHSKQSNAATNMSDFDYDWLFSVTADESGEPAQAVRAAALAQTVEAQARIIAMSPAIPIQRKH